MPKRIQHRKPPASRRTERLDLRLTPGERAEIDRRAAEVELCVAEYCRLAALGRLLAEAPAE